MNQFFKHLISFNFKLNLKKCEFVADQLIYLGYEISQEGDVNLWMTILSMPDPSQALMQL